MSARKPSKVNGNQDVDTKESIALQQYNDTDGHFSLVRCVSPFCQRYPLLTNPNIVVLQELPTC